MTRGVGGGEADHNHDHNRYYDGGEQSQRIEGVGGGTVGPNNHKNINASSLEHNDYRSDHEGGGRSTTSPASPAAGASSSGGGSDPVVKAAVVVSAAAITGCFVLGPIGLLIGAASVGIGVGVMQIQNLYLFCLTNIIFTYFV